ncbi:hypothetical protein Daus18300_012882 [Diaporthe australafricana]|uniref:Uncharacterized protein n=1 Tax=Diaporthe australafricana TaxID=127596 RepID=A0ABR3W153_9PEZI
MPADRSPSAHPTQEGHHTTPVGDEPSTDDEFPDVLSEEFKELCQRYNQEREREAAEAGEADVVGAAKPAKTTVNSGRARVTRCSPRVKAAFLSRWKVVVPGVRHSERIGSRAGKSP